MNQIEAKARHLEDMHGAWRPSVLYPHQLNALDEFEEHFKRGLIFGRSATFIVIDIDHGPGPNRLLLLCPPAQV